MVLQFLADSPERGSGRGDLSMTSLRPGMRGNSPEIHPHNGFSPNRSADSCILSERIMEKKNHMSAQHNARKWLSVSVIVTLVIGYLVVMFNSHVATQPTEPSAAGRLPGETVAPSFTLTDIHGRTVSLSDFRGKVVILDFWATWCPPCKKEIPDFIDLQREYGARGVQIVGVGLDEPENIREFARSHGINYPVLLGNDEVSSLYGGISGIPTTFIIDKQGNIAVRFEGFTQRAAFEREIASLL